MTQTKTEKKQNNSVVLSPSGSSRQSVGEYAVTSETAELQRQADNSSVVQNLNTTQEIANNSTQVQNHQQRQTEALNFSQNQEDGLLNEAESTQEDRNENGDRDEMVEVEPVNEEIVINNDFKSITPDSNPVAHTLNAIEPAKEIKTPGSINEVQHELTQPEQKDEQSEQTPSTQVPGSNVAADDGSQKPPSGGSGNNTNTPLGDTISRIAVLQSDPIRFQPPVLTSRSPDVNVKVARANALSTQFANQFMTQSLTQVTGFIGTGDVVAPVLRSEAEVAKSLIYQKIEAEQIRVQTSINEQKNSIQQKALVALVDIETNFTTKHEVIQSRTEAARQTLGAVYSAVLQQINTMEQEQYPGIDQIYETGAQKFRDKGMEIGLDAQRRQYERAAGFMVNVEKVDDNFLDGPLTYNRAKARYDAARKVGDGYKDGLIDEGIKQVDQLLNGDGKVNDYNTITTIALQSKESLTMHYQTSLESINTGEQQALMELNKVKEAMITSVRDTETKTLDILTQQNDAQQTMLHAFGERQITVVERDVVNAIQAIKNGVDDAAGKILESLEEFKAQMNGTEVPDPGMLSGTLATIRASITQAIESAVGKTTEAIGASQQGLAHGSVLVVEGITGLADTGIEEAFDLVAGFDELMAAQKTHAINAFNSVDDIHSTANSNTATVAIDGMTASTNGLVQLFDTIKNNIAGGLDNNIKVFEESLQAVVNTDMVNKSIEEEDAAAEKVQPRWKTVLKVLIVIVVIVVVALVIGPAVIGFIAGAAASMIGAGAAATAIGAIVGGAIVGALAGAVIQVANNLIDGKEWYSDVGEAIIIGAIGGALGGAGGALGQIITKGASGIAPALIRFGVDMVFDVGGGILGDLAAGNPITLEGVLMGAAIGAGVSISMGSLSTLKGTALDIGGFATKVTDIQTRFYKGGESAGVNVGNKIKSVFGVSPDVPLFNFSRNKPKIDNEQTTSPRPEETEVKTDQEVTSNRRNELDQVESDGAKSKVEGNTWTKPKGWKLPKNGNWSGQPGNSDFIPNNPKELGLDVGDVITFKEGYPDFSPWKKGEYRVPNMDGTDGDFSKIHEVIAREKGFIKPNGEPNKFRARKWLADNQLSPHHAGGDVIELIPYQLHGCKPKGIAGITHHGGAHQLRSNL